MSTSGTPTPGDPQKTDSNGADSSVPAAVPPAKKPVKQASSAKPVEVKGKQSSSTGKPPSAPLAPIPPAKSGTGSTGEASATATPPLEAGGSKSGMPPVPGSGVGGNPPTSAIKTSPRSTLPGMSPSSSSSSPSASSVPPSAPDRQRVTPPLASPAPGPSWPEPQPSVGTSSSPSPAAPPGGPASTPGPLPVGHSPKPSEVPVGGASALRMTTEKKGTGKASSAGPRTVRLFISRIDVWSVAKLSFLVSVGIALGIIVATFVLWLTLDTMGVFNSVNSLLQDATSTGDGTSSFDLNEYIELGKVLSLATIFAVIDVVILTVLGVLLAGLYNIVAMLVGGVRLTMTDE